ncbi:MAG: peptide chain release factor N(5)-glutamine methyltransferase [Candidatus Saganbacteria bacterium]|nr:peptide chain release factor N(5)-glutamine methyltransferase [Candidatus Saganbacteria bacterium]
MQTWTIKTLLGWTTDYFKKFNIEWPHLEAEILLAHTLNLKRIELYTNFERELKKEELAQFKKLIQRRSLHEPLAYITRYQPFMSLDFYVDPAVLIPRPETEKMVEVVIDVIKKSNVQCPVSLLDIGTGSGAIAVTLAKYLPNIKVIGIDSSADAIKIAQKNAEAHKVADRCQFMVGNMFEGIKQKFDIIVSNPPYIPTADIDKLEADVKDWEPKQALDGGPDGLDYIRTLINEGPKYLKDDGYLIFEFGINQAERIKDLAKGIFKEFKIIKDNSGLERIFIGKK